MWRFTTAWDSDGHPLLHSLNGNVGRQVRRACCALEAARTGWQAFDCPV